MQTQQIVNNVPVDQLMETMEAIRENPKIARFVFRAENNWQDGGYNRATANEFHDARGFLGMDENIRNGYEQLRVTFKVEGNASDEELDELVRIARERSPVFDVVANGTPVSVERVK